MRGPRTKPADNQSVKDRAPLPWRVFGVIGLLIVVTAYSALNLDNRSDVSLGVHTFRGVPVFLTSLIALILGAVLIVPLTLRKGARPPAAVPAVPVEDAEPAPAEPEPKLPDGPPQSDAAADEQAPADAPRRRGRWPFGARRRDPHPDEADARDRDTSGGG